jgi:glycerophosphoryl diester phosphodiesterase
MLVRMQLAPLPLICGLSLVVGAVAGGDGPKPLGDRPTTIAEFMDVRTRPIVIAHRGFSAEAPENTLVAVRAAIAAGADMVEVDVTLTADGEVVVIHDDTLDRTTDGSGPVADHTLEQLLRLDAGSWFARRFRGERIPTLAQVLDEVRGRILINVEIKPEAVGEEVEGGIAERVVKLIEERDMRNQVIVSSFEPRALQQIDEIDPEIATASLYNEELHRDMDPLAIVGAVGDAGHRRTVPPEPGPGRGLHRQPCQGDAAADPDGRGRDLHRPARSPHRGAAGGARSDTGPLELPADAGITRVPPLHSTHRGALLVIDHRPRPILDAGCWIPLPPNGKKQGTGSKDQPPPA